MDPQPLNYAPRHKRIRRRWIVVTILFAGLIVALVRIGGIAQLTSKIRTMGLMYRERRKIEACMDYVAPTGQVGWDDSVSPPAVAPVPAEWMNFWGKIWAASVDPVVFMHRVQIPGEDPILLVLQHVSP